MESIKISNCVSPQDIQNGVSKTARMSIKSASTEVGPESGEPEADTAAASTTGTKKVFHLLKYGFVLILMVQIVLTIGFLFYAVAQSEQDLQLKLDSDPKMPPESVHYFKWRARLVKKFLIIAAIVGITLDMVAIWGVLAENRCMVLTYGLISLSGNVMQMFSLRPDAMIIINFLFGCAVTGLAFYMTIQIRRKQRVYDLATPGNSASSA